MAAKNLTTFGALPVGAKFKNRGELFTKIAASMAADRQRNGVIFQTEAEVEPQPETGAQEHPDAENPS